jgi:V8-like Glu-specific endopeptidase
MTRLRALLFCVVLVLIHDSVFASPQMAIGETEDRERVELSEVPWLVRLVVKKRAICSGAAISPRHIVTAGHCLFKPTIDQKGKVQYEYMPDVFVQTKVDEKLYGKAIKGTAVLVGDREKHHHLVPYEDWAIIETKEDLGLDSYLKIARLPFQTHLKNISVDAIGYPAALSGAVSPYRHKDCYFLLPVEKNKEEIGYFTTCDMSYGMSGGPIIAYSDNGDAYLVGIVSGGDTLGTDKMFSLATSVFGFYEKAKELQRTTLE